MADIYTDQATQQLAPVFDQQIKNIAGQLPAIEQLYKSLYQGLDTQAATETQNIYEGAQQRGVLRSSLTTDLQTGLGQALIAQKGQLGAQQAKETSAIQNQIGELNIQKAQAITNLSQQLQTGALSEREYQRKVLEADRQYELEKQKLASDNANQAANRRASSSANNVSPTYAVTAYLTPHMGGDGFVSPDKFKFAKGLWIEAGGSNKEFMDKYWSLTGASSGQKNEGNWKAYYY